MESLELNKLWGQIKSELIAELPANVHPWIQPLEISGYDNGVITAVTGQMMGRDLLRRNYYELIVSIIKKITKDPKADINIIYDENAAKSIKKENEQIKKRVEKAALKEQAMANLSYMQSASNLNLKYKFENFVVGKSNEFAYKVTKAVAENPAKKYNPLFIYGNSGLGKTHLMQAIGHYTMFKNPKLKVRYTKTEDYINDFISNSRNSKDSVENMSKFNKKYTGIDIILIDDIQFIESKKKTMAQMQYTFDSLYNKGKQIVITSDRLPKDIPSLTSALCSRFEMGLMLELTPPDKETRIEILKKLAKDFDMNFPPESLDFISEHFSTNVRELEGAFNKVLAFCEINEERPDLEIVKQVLNCSENEDDITLEKIAEVVSEYYGITLTEIKSSSRAQKISQARHFAVYLSRELLGKSFENIAEFYNKKHPTILFAYEKIKKEISNNKETEKIAREIRQALKLI